MSLVLQPHALRRYAQMYVISGIGADQPVVCGRARIERGGDVGGAVARRDAHRICSR